MRKELRTFSVSSDKSLLVIALERDVSLARIIDGNLFTSPNSLDTDIDKTAVEFNGRNLNLITQIFITSTNEVILFDECKVYHQKANTQLFEEMVKLNNIPNVA